MTSVGNAAQISGRMIEETINLSLQASYDEVIRKSYEEYLVSKNEDKLYGDVMDYMKRQYKYTKLVSNTKLLFNMELQRNYETFSNPAGSSYNKAQKITTDMVKALKLEAKDLGTKTKLTSVDGHLFMIRNLVTKDFVPFATLVFELNRDTIFDAIKNVVWQQSGQVYVDESLVYESKSLDRETKSLLDKYYDERLSWENMPQTNVKNTFFQRSNNIASSIVNANGQKLTIVTKLNEKEIVSESGTYMIVFSAMFVLLVPLLAATFYYFFHNISFPISKLVSASEHIEKGKYGYKIEKFDRNEEFERLIDTFNHMSESLEESFNRIYAEEVAARDANMKALQAQINPHFLNNTLEIINWKARLSGNEDVSKMISALSTMMNATMDRKNEAFITIEEELRYVDAYLYIIYARFGGKFKFTQEVDEQVLTKKIPRLIIQPLVENVVEHTGDSKGNMEGKLIVRMDGDFLKIRVENNGNLTEENKERIQKLLSQTKLGDSNENIGIRNVNLRLKLLYGEDSGLTITNEVDGLTVSEILIENKEILPMENLEE
jgi:two-component system sensor histidine kinase YesM